MPAREDTESPRPEEREALRPRSLEGSRGRAKRDRRDLIDAAIFGPPLGAVLVLVACLGLGLAHLLEGTPLLGELVPLFRVVSPSELTPFACAAAFVLGFAIVLWGAREARARGEA